MPADAEILHDLHTSPPWASSASLFGIQTHCSAGRVSPGASDFSQSQGAQPSCRSSVFLKKSVLVNQASDLGCMHRVRLCSLTSGSPVGL